MVGQKYSVRPHFKGPKKAQTQHGAFKRPHYNIYDVSVGEIKALKILEMTPSIDESLLDWKVAAFGEPALQCMHKN